jgi:hypothetical protein
VQISVVFLTTRAEAASHDSSLACGINRRRMSSFVSKDLSLTLFITDFPWFANPKTLATSSGLMV